MKHSCYNVTDIKISLKSYYLKVTFLRKQGYIHLIILKIERIEMETELINELRNFKKLQLLLSCCRYCIILLTMHQLFQMIIFFSKVFLFCVKMIKLVIFKSYRKITETFVILLCIFFFISLFIFFSDNFFKISKIFEF